MISITVNDNKYVGMTIGNYILTKKVNISDGEFSIMPEEDRKKLANMVANNIVTVARNGELMTGDLVASGDLPIGQAIPSTPKSNGVSQKKFADLAKLVKTLEKKLTDMGDVVDELNEPKDVSDAVDTGVSELEVSVNNMLIAIKQLNKSVDDIDKRVTKIEEELSG